MIENHNASLEEWEMRIGEQVRDLRLRQNLTQLEVARRANIDRTTVGRIESGHGGSIASLVQIARALDREAWLDSLAPPVPTVSPIEQLRAQRARRRQQEEARQSVVDRAMTYTSAEVVEVRAWDRTVGAIALDPATGFYAFEYEPDWVATGEHLSPLQMPNRPGVFVFPELSPQTFHGLPATIADCLPDRFGNALVDAWMQEQGIRTADITPLDRLTYAANRGMGALEFHPPAGTRFDDVTALQLADLVTAARAALTGNLGEAPRDALHDLIQVGTSAGGARAKAVVAYNPTTGQIRSGQLTAPEGFEHWLIKLDGVGIDPTRESGILAGGAGYGLIEFAYHLMASAAGVTMSECRLLPEGPRTHFMTRRFDRRNSGERVHLQSLCGIAGLDFNMAGAHSYAQYMSVIEQLGMGVEAREQAFRRVVFNIAAVNRDDHTKNLGFLLPQNGEWELAPAYDVTHAHNPSGQWTDVHQMSLEGKREGIDLSDLQRFADRFRVPGYRAVIADVLDAVDRWPEFAEESRVDSATAARLAADIASARPG